MASSSEQSNFSESTEEQRQRRLQRRRERESPPRFGNSTTKRGEIGKKASQRQSQASRTAKASRSKQGVSLRERSQATPTKVNQRERLRACVKLYLPMCRIRASFERLSAFSVTCIL